MIALFYIKGINPMANPNSFKNHFIIAMPSLLDPNFFHAVTYICEHTTDGAMGIVINQPLNINLGEVLEHMDIPSPKSAIVTNAPVFYGGPIQRERGFVLHPPEGIWQSSLELTERLAITTSRDILEAIARGEGPKKAIVALGYAAWEEGQLEKEMAANTWLCIPATEELLFSVAPEDKWKTSTSTLGFDMNQILNDSGHA